MFYGAVMMSESDVSDTAEAPQQSPPSSNAATTATVSNGDEKGDSQLQSSSHSNLHTSTAEKVFSGRSGSSFMCGNFSTNPFSVKKDDFSASILAKPKLSLKPNIPSSASSTVSADNGDFRSNALQLSNNAFLRPAKLRVDDEEKTMEPDSTNDDEKSTENETRTEECVQEKTEESENVSNNTSEEDEPNTLNNSTTNTSSLSGSASGFTFGQNISSQAATSTQQSSFVFGEHIDERVTNVTKENGDADTTDDETKPDEHKSKTLEEAADEYEKQKASGPLLPEVETFTGEENESNVLQTGCKLFLFDKTDSSWRERGRGLLRLNDDSDNRHSRVVMRTSGILKVILNTQIWPGMLCQRPSQKSVRITGMDGDSDVHVYLLTGSAADMDHLYNAITCRIQRLKQQEGEDNSDSTSIKRKAQDESVSPKRPRAAEVGSDQN